MSRTVLALVFAVAMSTTAMASTVQFSVNGVPTDGSVPVEVVPSQQVEIGIYVTPDFDLESFTIDFFETGPWVPLPKTPGVDLGPGGTGDVQFPAPWDPGLSDAQWFDSFGVWSVGGFVSGTTLFTGPGDVATFVVHIPDVAESTILNLEVDFVELTAPGFYDDSAQLLPLALHVTPEPATLGLLALGGLAALRRRFA
jgi:hypothetical protein